ncbi:fumarylacetoacetase [Sphingobium chlorophenolicum L-1]|uniref:fumarylacetoacetase n=1 Tax=Sphingobium chlorophenolicum L-1 TaxID=690566 RepID=F6EWX6_SPHCR|nr:fumarylacetoacetase [Sphingobium chlorophenolicum]AEG48139.1 fumarylacetoacetase [Sphingobium chlorophenolicum L-1]
MSVRLDETHDPARTSWVEGANRHPQFPIQNLPFGIFSPPGHGPRAGVAIGDHVLDIKEIVELLPPEVVDAVSQRSLNRLFALGSEARVALRRKISAILSDPSWSERLGHALFRTADCTLHLPSTIGDYTDFYVGIHHAENVGRQFRPENPLLPNYKWVPIGYHGRASSIRPSGEPVRRPQGQSKAHDSDTPSFGPCQRLDYELEMGIWVGPGNDLGQPIPIGEAHEHIVGLTLLNDWSARDVQAWEYQPLGPFLSKSFHSTISPWVVTMEALAPFRTAQPPRPQGDPAPLPYLNDAADQASGAFSIELEVLISSETMRKAGQPPLRLSRGPATSMYWTVAQIVTHHASNGCNLQPGDLLGTGTLSGPELDQRGSLLELSEGGKTPIILPTGQERRFLEDGDELTIAATARAGDAIPIGFGPCTARILPALP